MFGRRKNKLLDSVSEEMDYAAVTKFLSNCDEEIEVNFEYLIGTRGNRITKAKFEDLKISDVIMFLEKKFKPIKGEYYFEANRNSYLREENERHKIELIRGKVSMIVGTREMRKRPDQFVTLDYIIEMGK